MHPRKVTWDPGPETAWGRVNGAMEKLPGLPAFPHLLRAVRRVMAMPQTTVFHDPHSGPVGYGAEILHVYSPVERGQILSFAWWAYVNRKVWSRARRRAAITLLSPLMLFSSPFFAEMTGLTHQEASRCMTRSDLGLVRRVAGVCDLRMVHLALEAATRGDEAFRLFTADSVRGGDIPVAMAVRLTGVPESGLLSPERGVQFTPVGPDLETLSVRSREELMLWIGITRSRGRLMLPRVYGQDWVRDMFPEVPLRKYVFTSTPVPRAGEECYHLCIPGLPGMHRAEALGRRFYDRVYAWENKYLLRAAMETE